MRNLVFLTVLFAAASVAAQAPTGTISGTVVDQVGAVLPGATVTVTNKATGAVRTVATASDGSFQVPSLPAGSYDVLVELSGFQPTLSPVEVVTGQATSLRPTLQIGARTEVVTVQGVAPLVQLESNSVQGVVGRSQIETLPLNGRSFLNLAALQPGVTVVLGNPAQFNAQFNVSVLGAPASRTAITVDGGNVRNPIEGGTGQNFSQEVVQEFQISTTNFDLSTGITGFGAVNIITRSGTNDFRGTAYTYFRNDAMAAYPSLARNSLTEDPDFKRSQSGGVFGGPIRRNRAHFFASYEYSHQDGVYVVQPDLRSVAEFGALAPAPYRGHQGTGRVDFHVSDKTNLFVRYSHDSNTNSGPFGIPVPPSNFVSNDNYVDQQLVGLTSILSNTLVNDLRFSHMYWKNRNTPATCIGDINTTCLGAGGPEVYYLNSVNFALGNNFNSPQGRDLHRFPISDNVTWQKGTHSIKFGGEWEHINSVGYWGFFDPARAYLLSPEFLAGINPALPPLFGLPDGKIHNMADLQKLPVVTFLLGIGDRAQPSYHADDAKGNDRLHFYVQDSWKMTPRFTLNYGLGWEHESNNLNYDLDRPQLLAPLYGSDLGPTKKEYKNFAPAAGFAYSRGDQRPTVFRGGAGLFYDTQLGWWRLGERAVLGGSGRQFIGNAAVTNPLTGQPFSTAYLNSLALNYGTFLQMLPTLRAQQEAKYPGTGDQPQILLSKQATALGALYPQEFPTARALHLNAGVQQQLSNEMAVHADVVYRRGMHMTPGAFFGASVDFNRFNAIGGPVIPRCVGAQANDPAALCSSGPMNFWWPGGRSEYLALLARVDKRLSNRYQFTVSYALQNSRSIQDITQNLDDYFATYGPDQPHHNLTVSATVDLGWDVQLSMLSSFLSRPPVAPTVAGYDNSGTNVSSGGYSPLLALVGDDRKYSDYLSPSDLEKLVQDYNARIAGTPTPAGRAGITPGQTYPRITLPSDYKLGDTLSSQDVRLTKTFGRGATRLQIIGEVFNIFNTSNLTNFNYNLVVPATFGKANQRVGQTFGSGGPRAFQVAGRFSF